MYVKIKKIIFLKLLLHKHLKQLLNCYALVFQYMHALFTSHFGNILHLASQLLIGWLKTWPPQEGSGGNNHICTRCILKTKKAKFHNFILQKHSYLQLPRQRQLLQIVDNYVTYNLWTFQIDSNKIETSANFLISSVSWVAQA